MDTELQGSLDFEPSDAGSPSNPAPEEATTRAEPNGSDAESKGISKPDRKPRRSRKRKSEREPEFSLRVTSPPSPTASSVEKTHAQRMEAAGKLYDEEMERLIRREIPALSAPAQYFFETVVKVHRSEPSPHLGNVAGEVRSTRQPREDGGSSLTTVGSLQGSSSDQAVPGVSASNQLPRRNVPISGDATGVSQNSHQPATKCVITASDLRECSRLTDHHGTDVLHVLNQYRLLVGLKARSVSDSEEFADRLAFEHIILIAKGRCVTMIQQLMSGMIDSRSSGDCGSSEPQRDTFDPPKTWSELKRALIDLLSPANAIQEAARFWLSLRQRRGETITNFSMRFREAYTRFTSAVARAEPPRNIATALQVSQWEAAVLPELQCLQYTGTPSVTLKQAIEASKRHESAGVSGSISALTYARKPRKTATRPNFVQARSARSDKQERPTKRFKGSDRNRKAMEVCEHPTCRHREGHSTQNCFMRKREARAAKRTRAKRERPASDGEVESESSQDRNRVDCKDESE